MFRDWNPHNLHLSIHISQANMYLFGTIFSPDLYPGQIYQLFQRNSTILVWIKELESLLNVLKCNVVLRLHKLEKV